MASKTVQPIAIELGIKGGEKLAALNRSFRDLSKQVKLSDADITQATKDIVKFATEAGNSEATIKGQIKAFEGLREQAALGGKAYTELTQGISKLQSTLRGSSDAVERERSNLVKLGSASKNSAKDLQYVIGQLEKLKSKVREDSAAFLQLGKDIKNLNVNLKEVEISAGKARFAINTILSAKPEKITGQIEKLNAVIASGTLEAEDLNIALRKLELLKVGAGRGPVAFRADVFSSQLGVDYFARLRKEYDNLEKTQAAISQRISEVNTELQNVSGYERRRSLTLELIRLNKELQQSIVNVTTREQFQAMAIRQRMGSARESYAASGFGAFSAEIRQRTAGGEFTPGMQRARERARNEIINEEAVRATTDIFDTWEQAYGRIEDAARGHKTEMARIQAAQGQLLIEKQNRINDELLRSNQAAYDKEVAEFDARLNRIEKLKSGEFASRQALGLGGGELSSLYGNIVGIGTSYARGQQEMMGRSPIQVFNDITSTFNRDLRRSGDARIEAERQLRDNLVREFGAGSQKLKAALERIPMGQMTTAQRPGAGEDLSAYVRRIEASTRGLEGVLTGFGKKTTNELRQARQSLVLFRDELDPTTASFERLEREAVASISRIDKELEKRQRSGRRGMSPMQMTQAAGAAISGGIFGGPEGFLGGAIGAIGGVGGAFAGAAIGAQVGGLRRQLGEFADYAAGIQRLQIALEGVAGGQAAFNSAIASARDVVERLNVPQETAIQGMTRLTAAVKGAGGGIPEASAAFKNVTAAIIATGGGAEQVEGAITALVQIFSKGKVSMEEINQIAERLPGAFNIFADAAGKTGPELLKGLQKGEIGLNDLMSFVQELGVRFEDTANIIGNSSQSAGARLRVAFNDMQIAVGEALQPLGAEIQSVFADLLEDSIPALIELANTTVSAMRAVGTVLMSIINNLDLVVGSFAALGSALAIGRVVAYAKQMGDLTTIIGLARRETVQLIKATTAFAKLRGALALLLNPWAALAAGIVAAGVGLYRAATANDRFNKSIRAGKVDLNEASEELEKLYERVNLLSVRLESESNNRLLQSLRRQMLRARQDAEETAKAIETLIYKPYGKEFVGPVIEGMSPADEAKSAFDAQKRQQQEEARKREQRAQSLLNAIEQRENAIAQARIQLEEQAANIRKQAIEQARQLEERFANQRLQKERELEDLRRQLAYVEEDIAFGAEEARAVAAGADPEIFAARSQIIEFSRQQKEEEIALDRQLLDEQNENTQALEEFKINNAKAINEANEAYAKQIGRIQQEYARSVAKIIEEGTGRAGERLELAGVIIANQITQAEAQATALQLGYSFKRGGKYVGPDLDFLTKNGVSVFAAAREAFIDAEQAIDRAYNSLADIPTATAIAAPAITSIGNVTAGLDEKAKAAASRLEAVRTQIKGISGDLRGAQVIEKISGIFAQQGSGIFASRSRLLGEQSQQRRALRLREEGFSGNIATQLVQQEDQAAEALNRLSAARDEATSRFKGQEREINEAFIEASNNIKGSADAVRDLTIALDNIPTEIKLRTAVVDAKQQLRDLVDTSNQVKGAATAIGDAFSQSFADAISGSKTAKEALADFFQSVGSYFLDMAKQIIAKMIQIAILNAVTGLLPGLGGGGLSGGLGGLSGTSNVPFIGSMPFTGFADGGTVMPGNTYMVGERGPELLQLNRNGSGQVINNNQLSSAMNRYRRSGSGATTAAGGTTEAPGGGVAVADKPIDVRYTVERINNVEYVTADQFQAGMREAAQQGAAQGERRTIQKLQMSPGTRRRLGL